MSRLNFGTPFIETETLLEQRCPAPSQPAPAQQPAEQPTADLAP